ncbi:putative serine/threonine-protein kinase pim-1-like, partial [Triplophysa rosa]
MFSAPVFETTGLLSGTTVITDTQFALRRMNSTTGGGVNIIRRDSVEKNTPPVEHPGRKMKKAMNAFFQKSWRVIRRACCCVYVDVEDEDFSDPQPGPSWAMEGQRSAAPEPDDRTESAPVSGPSSPEKADAKTKQAAEPEAAKPESSQRARAESASEKAKAKTNKRKRTKSVSPSSSTHPITDEPAVPKQSTELESSPADTLVTDLTEPVNAPFASLYDLGKKLDKKRCDLFVGTRKSDRQRVNIKVIPKLPHKRFVRI